MRPAYRPGTPGSADLRLWAARELRGYGPDDELPQYRVVGVPILEDRRDGRRARAVIGAVAAVLAVIH